MLRGCAALLMGCLLVLAPLLAMAEVVAPPGDNRGYQTLVLANGLRVLLVSDPATEQAAAALAVDAGSADEPSDRPGLAHFLEHMLFLGTEKYPEVGGYQRFLSQNGGSHNAYTSQERTNFFFDVRPEALESALDRFAQFFIAPRLDAAYVERERHAVDAEFQSGLRDDARRSVEAIQQVMNPASPLSRFNVGTLDSLTDRPGAGIVDALRAFHAEHYRAGRMALVVVGRQPLPDLRQLVSVFADIPAGKRPTAGASAPLFAPGALPAQLMVVPLGERRELTLLFPVAGERARYRSRPLTYIANLVGHEGQGSLLSDLKRRGWAEGLVAGGGFEHGERATLNITIRLTPEGLARRERVVEQVFAYLALLRREGPHEWRFDEQRRAAETGFALRERAAPLPYARALAEAMFLYPDEDLLRGSARMDQYRPALIREALDQLVPDNCLVVVMARGVSTALQTPRYGARYRVAPVTADWLARWQQAAPAVGMSLPAANPYLAGQLGLVAAEPGSGQPPRPERINERLTVWLAQDLRFAQPKSHRFISLRSPLPSLTARDAALNQLLGLLLADALNETLYPATLANMSIGVAAHARGLTLSVSGPSDKQARVMDAMLEGVARPVLTQDRFDSLRAEWLSDLRNLAQRPPFQQALGRLRTGLVVPAWREDQLAAELPALTLDDVRAYARQLVASASAEVLLHGNVTREDARQLVTSLQSRLGLTGRVAPPVALAVRPLPTSAPVSWRLPVLHREQALVRYRQVEDDSEKAAALLAYTTQRLEAPFFESLRTRQQLGYVVAAMPFPLIDRQGVALVVQSPRADVRQIDAAIHDFLHSYASSEDFLDPQAFARHRQVLVAGWNQQPRNLAEQAARYWEAIHLHQGDFDRRLRLARAAAALELDAWQRYYREVFLQDNGWLSVQAAPVEQAAPRPFK